MSMLWFLPVAIVLVGSALALAVLARVEQASRGLRAELEHMEQVRVAVALVRVESARTHASYDRLPRR